MGNRMTKTVRILSWLFVILWMIIIINLSSQIADQSNQLSRGMADRLIKAIKSIYPDAVIDITSFNSILRDLAHFFVYMIMAVLLLNALRRSRIKSSGIVPVMVICIIFAALDETMQLSVEGRGAQFVDVVIDSLGAGFGMILYLFIARVKGFRKREGN